MKWVEIQTPSHNRLVTGWKHDTGSIAPNTDLYVVTAGNPTYCGQRLVMHTAVGPPCCIYPEPL